jgi:hypothetical protein
MICIAGGGDETGDPAKIPQEKHTVRDQRSYTGKGHRAGGLFFSDRNSGRCKEKKPSGSARGPFESGS